MSLPCPIGPMPLATAAPAPPLEPPGVIAASRGLSVRPCSALSEKMRMEKAGVLVRPMMIAPALRRFATTGASSAAITSRNATTPLVVASPCWSVLTFTVTGTPCSGPSASPRACAASALSAAASAVSSSTRTTALSFGLTAWSRARQASVASRAEARPSRISRARSVASSCQSSLAMFVVSVGEPRALRAKTARRRQAAMWAQAARHHRHRRVS
jgi:hypothetical protein